MTWIRSGTTSNESHWRRSMDPNPVPRTGPSPITYSTTYSKVNARITPRLLLRIDLRWLMWKPFATMAARKRLPFIPIDRSMIDLHHLHRDRVIQCLRQSLPWTTICKSKLDDPTKSQMEWDQMIVEALERRRARMGRTKGVINKHDIGRKRY